MSGISIEGGQIVITNGSRTVATTEGTLLQFLTDEQTFTANIDFPNANKSQLYQFQWQIQRNPGPSYFAIRIARSVVGALPQEWANTIVLGAAPAGADLFVGRISMTRTIAPSHTWLTQNISPVIPQGVFMPTNGGTMLVEAAAGIARAMTIDVQGGNLVARLQHSVGPAAGNFRQIGTMPPVAPTSSIPPNHITSGAENVAVGGAALPVWWTDSAPYYLNEGAENPSVGPTGGAALWCRYAAYGWPNAVSYTDPTDYSTRYAITVKGRFGRRS